MTAVGLATATTSLWLIGSHYGRQSAGAVQQEAQQTPLDHEAEKSAPSASSARSVGLSPPTSAEKLGSEEAKKPGPESSAPQADPLESATTEIEALQKETKGVATSLVESFPNSPGAFCVLGLVYNAAGERAKAAESWEKALKLDPGRPDLYLRLATLAHMQGQYEKVIDLCRTGLVKCAPTPVLYRGMGIALISLGRPEEAVTALQRAIEMSPQDGENHQLLGNAYAMLKQHEKAKASYESAVRLQPRNVFSHYGLAMACANLGLEEESQRSLDQYHKLAAENMSMQRGSREVSHAVEWEKQILAETCAEAAMVYNGERRFAKAEELLRRAAVVAPTNTAYRIWRAALLVNAGRAEEAIPIYRAVIAIEPKNPRHYLALAQVYARLRRLDDARAAAKAAVDLEPDNEECRQMLQQLQARR